MPTGVTLQITGKQGLTKFSGPRIIQKWETEVAPILMAEIRHQAPVGNDPGAGRLRDSINMRKGGGRGPYSVEFTSTAPYANYVENGTSPHRIEPRQALALHWTSNGGDVFAAYVNHPGTKANPFVKRAIDNMMPLMKRMLRNSVEDELKP